MDIHALTFGDFLFHLGYVIVMSMGVFLAAAVVALTVQFTIDFWKGK